MPHSNVEYRIDDFYFFKIKPMWRYFGAEHPAFWLICGYLFVEYFRPQSIYPALDVLPWAKTFLIGALLFSFFDSKSKFQWTWTHTWITLFAVQIHFSILLAYDASESRKYYIDFFQWIVIFFIVTRIVNTRERLYIFLMIFFLCSLKIAVGTARIFAMRGFSFTSWGLGGPPGFFQNSGELAIQMVILFALSLYLVKSMWSHAGKFEKLVLVAAIVAPALTIIGASSRGSQLALAVVLLVYFNFRLLNLKILIVAVLAFFALWYVLPPEQKERFQSLGEDSTSIARKLYWKNGIEMIRDHPLSGVGLFNFVPYYSAYYPRDVVFINSEGKRQAELPHNILVQVGTDGGIPALVFYLAIILSLVRRSGGTAELRAVHAGLAIGMMGFFLAGQFVTVGYYPFLWISAAIMVSLRLAERAKLAQGQGGELIDARRREEDDSEARPDPKVRGRRMTEDVQPAIRASTRWKPLGSSLPRRPRSP